VGHCGALAGGLLVAGACIIFARGDSERVKAGVQVALMIVGLALPHSGALLRKGAIHTYTNALDGYRMFTFSEKNPN
jgi:hypothetical protein